MLAILDSKLSRTEIRDRNRMSKSKVLLVSIIKTPRITIKSDVLGSHQSVCTDCAPYYCPLCGISLSGHVKRRVQRVHLPSFGNPPLAPTTGLGISYMLSFVGQSEDQNLHNWCHLVNGKLGRSINFRKKLNFVVEYRLYPNLGNFCEGN